MKFLLAKKLEMTQYFDETGNIHPATLLIAEPNKITFIRTPEKDGYSAAQVSFGVDGKKKEFRLAEEDVKNLKADEVIDVSVFGEGDKVRISGISKGKGFQGVVKRHGFKGGPRSHGQKHSEREPGSIGGGGGRAGGRVVKGMRMAGRMGSDRITVKNLIVLKVDKGENKILISGAVPGRRGTLIEIRSL